MQPNFSILGGKRPLEGTFPPQTAPPLKRRNLVQQNFNRAVTSQTVESYYPSKLTLLQGVITQMKLEEPKGEDVTVEEIIFVAICMQRLWSTTYPLYHQNDFHLYSQITDSLTSLQDYYSLYGNHQKALDKLLTHLIELGIMKEILITGAWVDMIANACRNNDDDGDLENRERVLFILNILELEKGPKVLNDALLFWVNDQTKRPAFDPVVDIFLDTFNTLNVTFETLTSKQKQTIFSDEIRRSKNLQKFYHRLTPDGEATLKYFLTD